MKEPRLPLWNRDNSDVLPRFQITFGHALFRGVSGGEWRHKLFKSLGLSKPGYTGALQTRAIPRHPDAKCLVLGSSTEIHLLIARLADVWNVFGPHDLFFASKKWTDFSAKVGGLMAVVTQMDVDSFSYLVFKNGIKQTNGFVDGMSVRVVPDTPVTAYVGEDKVFEDNFAPALPDCEVRDLIKHDLAIRVEAPDALSISFRFPDTAGPIEELTHVIFPRIPAAKSFLGFRLNFV